MVMPALHPTSTFNVEATLTQWLITKFATITTPVTLGYSIITVRPETGIQPPCFSVFHAGTSLDANYEGGVMGTESGVDSQGLMQVSYWLSRKPAGVFNPNWLAHLRAAKAMISEVFASPKVIRLSDYLSTPASPTPVTYVVRTMNCEFMTIPADPNADIERVTANIPYSWQLRTNVT